MLGVRSVTAPILRTTAPLPAEEVIDVDGLRVTSLARTAADLARTAEFTWAVVAADQALRRGVRTEELLAGVDAGPKRKGNAALRAVAAFADGRSGSVAESVSRVTMERAGLPKPVLQFAVTGAEGWKGCSDFGRPEHGMVGEMDGEAKYKDRLEAKRQSPGRCSAPSASAMTGSVVPTGGSSTGGGGRHGTRGP